jgi:hypothetical protein
VTEFRSKYDDYGDPLADASAKFGVDDSLAMDTGHGDRRPPLTEEEIVDRAAQRQHDSTILLVILAMCLLSAISIYKPVHTWLHAHLQLLAGILLGSVLEAWMWLMYCRRPWRKR